MRPFADGFAPMERAWLNCSHQGPLPVVAVRAAEEAIRWKQAPYELTSDRFVEVRERLRRALARLIHASVDDVVLGNSASYGLHLLANGLRLRAALVFGLGHRRRVDRRAQPTTRRRVRAQRVASNRCSRARRPADPRGRRCRCRVRVAVRPPLRHGVLLDAPRATGADGAAEGILAVCVDRERQLHLIEPGRVSRREKAGERMPTPAVESLPLRPLRPTRSRRHGDLDAPIEDVLCFSQV